jgi:hypothetical protein
MEIDATTMRLGNCPPFIINISRSLCRAWNLCFCCLKPVVPVTHTSCLNCLNPPITLAQCEAFFKHCQQSTATTSVAAIQSEPRSEDLLGPPLTYHPTEDFQQEPGPLAEAELMVMGNYRNYNDYKGPLCLAVNVPVNTVHVRMDCSKGGQLIVLVSFKTGEGALVTANILVDTGVMANFISEDFVQQHDLKI